MTLDDYLDLAKERQGFKSDLDIGRALGFAGQPVSHWRTKRTWPADQSMVDLAMLAGIPAEQALMDLNTWRAQSPVVASVYQRIAAKIKAAPGAAGVTSLMLAALLWAFPASAGTQRAQINSVTAVTIHYANLRRRLRRRFPLLINTFSLIPAR
jgi:hypothetical protein